MCRYFCIGFIDFMFKDRNLTDITNLFSPKDSKKNNDIILKHLKMAEYNSPDIYPSLNDQQFRLNKISEVRDYFIGEIREGKLMSKKLSKCIDFGYYLD